MDPTKPEQTDDKTDDLDEVQEQMRSQGSQDDLDRQARIEYLRSIAGPRKPKRPWLKIGLITLFVLLAAAGAVYWFVLREPGSQTAQKDNSGAEQTGSSLAEETENVPTKHHESTNFTLGFDYPENWTVKDEGNGKLTVVSPAVQLKPASGSMAHGQIAIIVQGKQTALDAFKKGNAVAARDSEKIAYTKPTQNQRAQTYLSFLTYAGSNGSGIDGIYITGDIGYQKGQAVPQADVVQVDPLVTVAFWKCDNKKACTEGAAFAVAASSWNDTATLTKSVKTILSSLSIQ